MKWKVVLMLCALLFLPPRNSCPHTDRAVTLTVAHLEMSHRDDSHTSLSALTAEARKMCQTIYNPRFTALGHILSMSLLWIIILLHTFLQGEWPRRIPLGGSAGHFQLISLPVASGGILPAEVQKQLDRWCEAEQLRLRGLSVGFRLTRSV